MLRYGYLVVEGPHDIEFAARLLKPYGLERVKKLSELDPFWKKLVPDRFPPDGEDLLKRVPVPTFLQSTYYSIALHSAIGDTRLIETIEESLSFIQLTKLVGIGLMADTDKLQPEQRFSELIKRISSKRSLALLSLPSSPGHVQRVSSYRFGIFILPDNQLQGTLETILLECAQANYHDLFEEAQDFVDNIDKRNLEEKDLEEYNKPAGKNKAIVASIVSILKPGKSTQVSIQDNRWIDTKTIALLQVKKVQDFLIDLFNLS